MFYGMFNAAHDSLCLLGVGLFNILLAIAIAGARARTEGRQAVASLPDDFEAA